MNRISRYDPEFSKVTASGVAIIYNNRTYYNIGTHLYTNSEGKVTTDPSGQKITEWIYTQVNPVTDKNNFVGWGTTGCNDCYQCCQTQLSKSNLESGNYWPTAFQMYRAGKDGKAVTEESKIAGLDALHKAVESGKPIMVGVDYVTGSSNPSTDNTTDHFITIVGRGNDEQGEFFSFYENATGNTDEGTNVTVNKLYLQNDNTLKGNTTWQDNITLTVTQV